MSAPAVERGRLARSKAGRDKGRLCVVVEVVDEDFVLTCDGRLRTFDRPKKKRKKHLQPLIARNGDIAAGRTIEDHTLRSWIREEEEKLVQV
ncbi:MAG TPA: RNA-binding protein [Candidatus Pullichristensenella stercoripullorum]|nr:RNA-binding protein [Candidatus Pullichristensenella stercoripullorum]